MMARNWPDGWIGNGTMFGQRKRPGAALLTADSEQIRLLARKSAHTGDYFFVSGQFLTVLTRTRRVENSKWCFQTLLMTFIASA